MPILIDYNNNKSAEDLFLNEKKQAYIPYNALPKQKTAFSKVWGAITSDFAVMIKDIMMGVIGIGIGIVMATAIASPLAVLAILAAGAKILGGGLSIVTAVLDYFKKKREKRSVEKGEEYESNNWDTLGTIVGNIEKVVGIMGSFSIGSIKDIIFTAMETVGTAITFFDNWPEDKWGGSYIHSFLKGFKYVFRFFTWVKSVTGWATMDTPEKGWNSLNDDGQKEIGSGIDFADSIVGQGNDTIDTGFDIRDDRRESK